MADGSAWEVFISCATEDLQAAREVRAHLCDSGWSTFLSADDLNLEIGSTQWSERIDQILDASSVLLLLVTPRALRKRWVNYEWRSVHNAILSGRHGFVIPLCWEGPGPSELPRALRHYQIVDAREVQARPKQLAAVSTLIRGYLPERASSGASLRPVAHSRPSPPTRRVHSLLLGATLLAAPLFIWLVIWLARPIVQTPSAPKKVTLAPTPLRIPTQGLHVLSIFEKPTDRTLGEVRSVGAWQEAERDFEDAASQKGAPLRWKSGQQIAASKHALLLGDVGAAEAAARRAVAIEPGWATAYVALSKVLAARSPVLAIEAAQRARALDPSSVVAIEALAMALLYAGERERALEEYRRAIVLNPDFQALKGDFALALHSAGGQYDLSASLQAHLALSGGADVVGALLVLAEEALKMGNGREALERTREALTLAPRDIRLHLAAGDAQQLLGKSEAARDSWATALSLAKHGDLLGVAGDRLRAVEAALSQNRMPPSPLLDRAPSMPALSPAPSSKRKRKHNPEPAGSGACDSNDPLCGL